MDRPLTVCNVVAFGVVEIGGGMIPVATVAEVNGAVVVAVSADWELRERSASELPAARRSGARAGGLHRRDAPRHRGRARAGDRGGRCRDLERWEAPFERLEADRGRRLLLAVDGELLRAAHRASDPKLRMPRLDEQTAVRRPHREGDGSAHPLCFRRPLRAQGLAALTALERTGSHDAPRRRVNGNRPLDGWGYGGHDPEVGLPVGVAGTRDGEIAPRPTVPLGVGGRGRRTRLRRGGRGGRNACGHAENEYAGTRTARLHPLQGRAQFSPPPMRRP